MSELLSPLVANCSMSESPSIVHLAQEAEASPSVDKLLAQEDEVTPSVANLLELEAEASPLVANLAQEAADQYDRLLQNFKVGVNGSSYMLLDRESEKASKLRGLILGRGPELGATFDELWIGRLQYEVDFEKVEYNLAEGTVVKVIKTSALNNEELIKKLFDSLLVILQHRDPLEKAKFYSSCKAASEFNKSAVRALFHVGKQNKVELKHVVLDYSLRTKLVDVCLQRISQRCARQLQLNKTVSAPHVTEADATWAYERVIGDPYGAKRAIFDLSDMDIPKKTTFSEALSKLLQNGYLDIQAGVTKDTETETTAGQNTATKSTATSTWPSVRSYEVTSKKISFFVHVIDNPITQQFYDKCVSSFDRLKFTKGRGGKQRANVRNASTTEHPAAIVIASKYVYGGLPASNIEVEILQIANFIADFQRKIIEEQFCPDGFKVTFHCNLVHTVVAAINAALYGPHNDSSALLCSDELDYCHVAGDLWLPTRKDLQIMTLVLSNSKDKFSTNLVYTESEGGLIGKKCPRLRTIPLGSCCLHFQGAGSQLPQFLHQVLRTPGSKWDGTTWRMHCTMRFTLDPKTSPDEVKQRIQRDLYNSPARETIMDYNRVGVLSQITTYLADEEEQSVADGKVEAAPGKLDGDVDEMPPHQQTRVSTKRKLDSFLDLAKAPYKDTYPSIPKSQIDAMGIYRPGHIVRLGGSMAEELSAAPTLKMLFDQRYLVRLETESDEIVIPLLHEITIGGKRQLPVPGEYYNLSNVTADAGVNHNEHGRPILCRKESNDRVIIISQSYKNGAAGIKKYLQRLNDHLDGDDFLTDDFDGNIVLHGSGGSPDVSGSFAPSAASASKDDPQISLPLHQPMNNPVNIALQTMAWKVEVVTIYVNEAIFNAESSMDHPDEVTAYEETFGTNDSTDGTGCKSPKKKCNLAMTKKDTQQVRCLGTFYCSEHKIKSTLQEDVINEHQHESQGRQVYSRFKLVPHVEVTFTPFMSNKDFKQLRFPQTNENMRDSFQMLTIPYQCPHRIETQIGIGDAKQAASLNSSKAMFRSKVVQDFISNGGLSCYKSPKDAECVSADACLNADSYNRDDDDDGDEEETDDDEQEEKDDDEDLASGDCEKPKGDCEKPNFSASVADIVSAVALNNYAGALRFSKTDCLTAIDGTVYASPLKDDSLPGLFRLHPTPMSNRALDVVTLGQRDSAIADGLFQKCDTDESERVKIGPSGSNLHHDHLLDTLFKAVVTRFTGRLNPFFLYSLQRGKPFVLPSCTDLDNFLEFMETTIPTTNSLTQWLSKQHLESIPKSTKNMKGFRLFAKRVKELLPVTLVAMLNGGMADTIDDVTRRAAAVQKLQAMLYRCCDSDNTGSLTFMAQVIVADVEELFDDPFGKVTAKGVVAGQGGQEGHSMLKHAGGAKKLEDAINDIIEYVMNEASEVELAISGYRKDPHTHIVYNLINRRPFNSSDAEQFLCKVWTIAKLTTAHYDISRHPHPTKPHCHPVKFAEDNNPQPTNDNHPEPTNVQKVMECIIETYRKERSSLRIPDFCLMRGEQQKEWAALATTATLPKKGKKQKITIRSKKT